MNRDPGPVRTGLLVIGAGLAGLRAALAARRTAPDLPLILACPRPGPSGSSFANRNNALGMQAPDPGDLSFDAEVLALAAPGFADPGLAALLRQEAAARLAELAAWGLDFDRGPDGALARVPGCFSAAPRAVVFRDLGRAFERLRAEALAAGVEFRQGLEARLLLLEQGRAAGALFRAADGSAQAVLARAVVLAAGGPAPLFARRMDGPGNTGLSYGLLDAAGARLENSGFLQFFWNDARSGRFVSPAAVLGPGSVLHGPDQDLRLDAGHPALALVPSRAGHCPAGYGLDDAALDELLLAQRGPDGTVRLTTALGQEFRLECCAHAGNGGAVVDRHGQTSVAGLFACGECATGMHGANRLGGGMVLASQVFGARAGAGAARWAAGRDEPGGLDIPPLPRPESPDFMACIRAGMERHCLFGPRPGLAAFVAELEEGSKASMLARSALAVARDLLRRT